MPELTRDPIELLTNPGLKEPWLSNKSMAIMGGAAGFLCALYTNFVVKRPIYSGIQRHIGFAAIGAAAGFYIEKYRKDYFAEKDAIMRHFIEMHPEDFPRLERKKLKDVMEPWIPIR